MLGIAELCRKEYRGLGLSHGAYPQILWKNQDSKALNFNANYRVYLARLESSMIILVRDMIKHFSFCFDLRR